MEQGKGGRVDYPKEFVDALIYNAAVGFKETPTHCPKCGIELIFNGPGFGFCDNCSITIELA